MSRAVCIGSSRRAPERITSHGAWPASPRTERSILKSETSDDTRPRPRREARPSLQTVTSYSRAPGRHRTVAGLSGIRLPLEACSQPGTSHKIP